MARRRLYERTVTNVVAPDEGEPELLNNLASLVGQGLELKKSEDVAKMNNYASEAQLRMAQATNDWRVQNEGDPFNKDAVTSLQSQYKSILSDYDKNISIMSRKDWSAVSQKMIAQSKADHYDWATKTSLKNTERNYNSAIKNNLSMAYQLGTNGDFSKAEESYANAALGLEAIPHSQLGEETRKDLMKDFRADYMKSYLAGMAVSDPDKTLEVLSQEGIAETIGSVDNVRLIEGYAKKNKNTMLREQEKARSAAVYDEQRKILQGKSSFNQIDDRVGVDYTEVEAAKLKKMLVAKDAEKDNNSKLMRYLDKLREVVPGSDKKELEEIMDMVMTDATLSRNDKQDIISTGLLFDDKGKEEAGTGLVDMIGGNAEIPRSSASMGFIDSVRTMLFGRFGEMNDDDAAMAFRNFMASADGRDKPYDLMRKANTAITEVAVSKNPYLETVGVDWTQMQDVDTGEIVEVRRNEYGALESRQLIADDEVFNEPDKVKLFGGSDEEVGD